MPFQMIFSLVAKASNTKALLKVLKFVQPFQHLIMICTLSMNSNLDPAFHLIAVFADSPSAKRSKKEGEF